MASIISSGPVIGSSINAPYGSFTDVSSENAHVNDIFTVGGEATFSDALVAQSTLNVSGATVLSNALTVSGAATLSSGLGVTGNTTIGGTLEVAGNTTITGVLTAVGGLTFNTPLALTGSSTRSFIVNDDIGDTFVVDTTHDRIIVTGAATSSPAFSLAQSGNNFAAGFSIKEVIMFSLFVFNSPNEVASLALTG